MRRSARSINAGGLIIGGGSPVSIQSMTNTDTRDAEATLAQIYCLKAAGCELVRLAVPDEQAAEALPEIIKKAGVPLAADIHFDYRLALRSIEAGIHKLRINPGNIGSKNRVSELVKAASERGIPIRIGVNSGSCEKDLLAKYGGPTAAAMAESALSHVRILEDLNFRDIAISVKSSNLRVNNEAYMLLANQTDYPLHLGVTEAGNSYDGMIKSSVGIGSLLLAGIGDTIRVSLTADPIEEIACAKKLLQFLELRAFGPEIISCPTCGRTEIDLIGLAKRIEQLCEGMTASLKIAVMGCAVNGPGEAREADIGIAGGKGCGLIFRKGEIIRRADEDKLVEAFMEELRKIG
jgi:(E)-4-hydroxy-3-methylbut-2-enyl-diphosphate synthase